MKPPLGRIPSSSFAFVNILLLLSVVIAVSSCSVTQPVRVIDEGTTRAAISRGCAFGAGVQYSSERNSDVPLNIQ